jgi:PAS domain S-box-containing protein
MRHRTGAYRWVLGRAMPVRDDQGQITQWFGTCTDIQDIVEAREITARSHEHLEHEVAKRTRERDRAWRNSQDLLLVCDAEGNFRAVNPAWTRLLGWHQDELMGRSYLELVHPDDHATSACRLAAAETDGLPRYENRVQHKDGSYRWFCWAASSDEGLIYGSGRHVTAEKEAAVALAHAEEQLRQSQKMDAIGQLTGGIAHDFNNLLMGIIGSLELLQSRVAAGRVDGLERYATMAATSAQNAAVLTKRLLAFARRQPLDPKRVEANQVLAGMEDLLRRTLGPEIDLEMFFAGAVWPTLCDPNQLENAMLNLAINARDAMPNGGRLTIETVNADLDAAYAEAQGGDAKPGQYAAISVTDTGVGMTSKVIERAFDPFFTTKAAGKGTGLGLSMLHGFIKQSGGHVRVRSKPGQGTTFKVFLPRCRDETFRETALVHHEATV